MFGAAGVMAAGVVLFAEGSESYAGAERSIPPEASRIVTHTTHRVRRRGKWRTQATHKELQVRIGSRSYIRLFCSVRGSENMFWERRDIPTKVVWAVPGAAWFWFGRETVPVESSIAFMKFAPAGSITRLLSSSTRHPLESTHPQEVFNQRTCL